MRFKRVVSLLLGLIILFSSVGSIKAANKGYSQNDVTMKSNLSEKKIKELLPSRMKMLSKSIYNIENSKRPINALFLMSLIRLESGNGTSYSYRVRNNIGGVRGSKGYRTFSSKEECIYYMQDFLYRGYIRQGRKSIWRIGTKYCEGGNWASQINSIAIKTMRSL